MLPPNFKENLKSLAFYPQFVVWKAVPIPGKSGKFNKFPCGIDGGVVSAHDSTHWLDIDTAIAVTEYLPGEYGVGFVFTERDPFFFVDIDGCRDGEDWSDIANTLCGHLTGAMVEISHSGRGLHIIGSYSGPEPVHKCKNIPLGIECYTSGRFVALTGTSAIGDTGAVIGTQFAGVVGQYFAGNDDTGPVIDELTTTTQGNSHPIADDDKLIEAALKSKSAENKFGGGVTFKDLWTADEKVLGATWPSETGQSYDASSADASLAMRLMWWCGGNCERVAKLMRRSALVRTKWDNRKDYISRTLKGAFATNGGEYYRDVAPTPPVILEPTLEFNDLPRGWSYGELFGVDEDSGESAVRALHDYYGERLYSRGKWFMWWTGERYSQVEEHDISMSVASTLVGTKQNKKKNVTDTAYMLHVMSKRLTQVNPHSAKVFFNNGYIDFESDNPTLLPHDQTNLNTYVLPFAYTPIASEPLQFLTFLNNTFEGDVDRVQKIQAIQEIIGWALISSNLGIQKAVVLRGVTRGGKGTVLGVIGDLLGETSGYTPLSSLMSLTNDKVKTSLRDTNIAIDFDAKSVPGKEVDGVIGMINKITANESTENTVVYTQDIQRGPLNCKLYMACNTMPNMIDDSGAIVGRLHQIMFNNSALGNEDTHLSERLRGELEAIGNWAIEGLQRIVANRKFTVPASSVQAQEEANEMSQPMTVFINECLIVSSDHSAHREHIKIVYRRWVAWCDEQGLKACSSPAMKRRLLDTLRDKKVEFSRNLKIGGVNASGFRGVSLQAIGAAASLQAIGAAVTLEAVPVDQETLRNLPSLPKKPL